MNLDLKELEIVLADLRRFGTDTQDIEAKKALRGLPSSISQTLSAFANTAGGLILLGVDEASGAFDVTGVDDVRGVLAAMQTACAEMDPPIRATIETLEHSDGVVIAAQVPPVVRHQRPCHRRADGPHQGSFIRVGDGDQRLSTSEVAEMLAARAATDDTTRSVNGEFAPNSVAAFVRAVQDRTARTGMEENSILQNWGVVDPAGRPTLAGLLILGLNPQKTLQSARLTYRREPNFGDPVGIRHSGRHIEGTIGEILEDTITQLSRDLATVQVERGGNLADDCDVPRIALREILSNALVHRSFSQQLETVAVKVEVSNEAVVITSPGGIHVGTDPATLGMLMTMSGVRNHSLVRIAELATTPAGARIVEQQNMGIRSADIACNAAGLMPAIFVDLPTMFQVYLLRGTINSTETDALIAATSLTEDRDASRLFASATRLQEVHDMPTASAIRRVPFDARFAARVLAPSCPEDAMLVLRRLEDNGLLERVHTKVTTSWKVRPDITNVIGERVSSSAIANSKRSHRRGDQLLLELLGVIDASPSGKMHPKDIGIALHLSSPTSRSRRIRKAVDAGFIRPSNSNAFASNQSYMLTDQGRARLANES